MSDPLPISQVKFTFTYMLMFWEVPLPASGGFGGLLLCFIASFQTSATVFVCATSAAASSSLPIPAPCNHNDIEIRQGFVFPLFQDVVAQWFVFFPEFAEEFSIVFSSCFCHGLFNYLSSSWSRCCTSVGVTEIYQAVDHWPPCTTPDLLQSVLLVNIWVLYWNQVFQAWESSPLSTEFFAQGIWCHGNALHFESATDLPCPHPQVKG